VGVILGTGPGEPVESFESEEARGKKDKPPDDRRQRRVELERPANGIPYKGPGDQRHDRPKIND